MSQSPGWNTQGGITSAADLPEFSKRGSGASLLPLAMRANRKKLAIPNFVFNRSSVFLYRLFYSPILTIKSTEN
jgi:hypothetical protein